MRIAICASMVFSDQLMETKRRLEELGHTALVSDFTESHIGKSEKEREELTIKQKNEKDAMREYWDKIDSSDAILVLNYDRKGIENYIGGNAFLEMGFAYILRKKIFLLNDIPEIEMYKSEIEAMKPITIKGDLEKIK